MTTKSRWNDPYRPKADPRATLTRHRAALIANDGVVSVGLGFDQSHRTVIVVGVVSAKKAAAADVPSELDGVPVEVRVVGEFSAKEGDHD